MCIGDIGICNKQAQMCEYLTLTPQISHGSDGTLSRDKDREKREIKERWN